MKLLILGATGLVGGHVLLKALTDPRIAAVVAPTRRRLTPHRNLTNPLLPQLEAFVPSLAVNPPDAIICALGTTLAKAGSKAAFRHVDVELPLALAHAAHDAGVATFGIVTAQGASDTSRFFYYKTKGDAERAIQGIAFASLTLCRPSLIDGERDEARNAEGFALKTMRALGTVLPKRLRVNRADRIAAALLEAVIEAKPGCRRIESDEMI